MSDPEIPTASTKKKPPQGIGGWLILPAILLPLGVILGLYSKTLAAAHLSEIATDKYGGLFLTELALDTALLLLLIYATVLFFRKKRRTPTIVITYFALNFAIANLVLVAEIFLGLSDFVLGNLDSVINSLFSGAIWIPYFVISKRVQATFVK